MCLQTLYEGLQDTPTQVNSVSRIFCQKKRSGYNTEHKMPECLPCLCRVLLCVYKRCMKVFRVLLPRSTEFLEFFIKKGEVATMLKINCQGTHPANVKCSTRYINVIWAATTALHLDLLCLWIFLFKNAYQP